MTNRIVGNVYIIDSALGNVSLPWPSNAKIMAVGIHSINTTGSISFSSSDTSNVVIKLTHTGDHVAPNDDADYYFLGGINFTEMKVPILTAATGFIYFG